MKDSLPLALDLIADVARRPTFAAEEIERQRQQAVSGMKVALEDPDNVAGQVIDRLVYGFHPYGLPGAGTPATLTSLTRQDFIDFHKQYYVPNNALLAIVGDVGAGRGPGRRGEVVRRLAGGDRVERQADRPAAGDAARHRDRQERTPSDRNSGRATGHPAQARRLRGDSIRR